MILILTDKDEPTTDLIISWLVKLKKKFIRISIENKIEFEKVYTHPVTKRIEMIFSFLHFNDKIVVDTNEITSYWYRRSELARKIESVSYNKSPEIDKVFNNYRYEEDTELLNLLNYILDQKAKLNSIQDDKILKFQQLDVASQVGLKIPTTLVTRKKSDIVDLINVEQSPVITKPIGNPFSFTKHGMYSFTSLVDPDTISDTFDISQVQTAIDKKFELRIFYFNSTFYSSAVMSQTNEKTKIDLKNYDENDPNRVVPYKLPALIENKLTELMNRLYLKSGSIDMICDKNNEYIFLEVNPIGQFEQVSNPCNYDLYHLVAQYL